MLMLAALSLMSCAHSKVETVDPNEASRIDRKLVRDAVVFETGSRDGAVVPEISAPQLRAIIVEEHIDGNRLVERHREWVLEGESVLLGIPKQGVRPQ